MLTYAIYGILTMPHGPHCGAYYSNCAVIGHFTCQAAYVTGSGGMSYCNQTLFLSGRVGSGDETSAKLLVSILYIDLIRETISYYVIHFRMAKAHECPLAAMCTAVSGEAWKAVALGSFDSPRPQTWWYCRKKLLRPDLLNLLLLKPGGSKFFRFSISWVN